MSLHGLFTRTILIVTLPKKLKPARTLTVSYPLQLCSNHSVPMRNRRLRRSVHRCDPHRAACVANRLGARHAADRPRCVGRVLRHAVRDHVVSAVVGEEGGRGAREVRSFREA